FRCRLNGTALTWLLPRQTASQMEKGGPLAVRSSAVAVGGEGLARSCLSLGQHLQRVLDKWLEQPWEKLFCNHCRVTCRALCVERADLGFGSDWNCSWNLRRGFSKAAAEIWMKMHCLKVVKMCQCQCWSSGRGSLPMAGELE
uniref:Uncharacterized protein n=1 Tax=Junco hyemalis TaxID=40217 RepID=A0A8C5NSP2_JUNHY